MGLRFRKSVKMGPVRINFSKSGVGYSVGTKGYRVTKRADGRVQRTASIPGTGISHVKTVTPGTARSTAAPQEPKTKPASFWETGLGKFLTVPLVIIGIVVGIFLLFQVFKLILFLCAM